MSATCKKIVTGAHKAKKNRVYYEKCFSSINLKENGILQDEQKSLHDRVTLDESKNEFLRFYGFDQNGSHFDLSLSILSLYPQQQETTTSDDRESRWRLASVEFVYTDLSDNCRYSYQAKQLIDYCDKRRTSAQHESKNIYKIGSLSVEIVLPFSLSRIVFNGFLNKSSLDWVFSQERVSSKLTISTHPTSDKFDFQYRFDPEYVCKIIKASGAADNTNSTSSEEIERLLGLALEDRIDSPLMYQVYLERTDGDSTSRSSVLFWGAKVRRFIDPREMIRQPMGASEPMDDLFAWSKVGHQVHLTRPLNRKRLVNGMVSSSLDYASYLLDCKLMKSPPPVGTTEESEERKIDNDDGDDNDNGPWSMDFNGLESFASLTPGVEIHLSAFSSKKYRITVRSSMKNGLLEISINGYEGWALCRTHNALRQLKQAQSTLWALNIHDRKFSPMLACESLLGGKGNSLIDLNRFVVAGGGAGESSTQNLGIGGEHLKKRVSVPRGVVVSCAAHQIWLKSNPLIGKSIQELDNTRRALAARTACTNPLSDKYMPLAQSQQILREQCKRTCLLLNSCPLPRVLVECLRLLLAEIFTDDELKNPPPARPADGTKDKDDDDEDESKYKLFAVRSSAVGEDSLETSAAGQMRTILDARGFDSIMLSIVDCWSSQFEPEAVMYKTQNGLEFNLPMAVVVQELIPCKAAGVATTCDPLTGARSTLQILANLGLGEGVVSGNKTDTIRLSLDSLKWDERAEEYVGEFLPTTKGEAKSFYKVISDQENGATDCCLSGEQILTLGNLLIWLRRDSDIKDREVEWGITLIDEQQPQLAQNGTTTSESPPSSSSSSSSAATTTATASRKQNFQIHLLQSRPLTNLFKLSSREIDHELDYGLASPINLVSRANLGEVMPGALCPLTSSYFIPIVTNNIPEKPYEHQHTYKTFSANSFAFHAQVACMVLTYTDTMTRFGQAADAAADNQANQDRATMFRAMIGTTDDFTLDLEERMKLTRERVNPLSRMKPSSLADVIALDSGLWNVLYIRLRRALDGAKFENDLTSLESYIEQLEQFGGSKPDSATAPANKLTTTKTKEMLVKSTIQERIEADIGKLFERLTNSASLLGRAWNVHIRATLLNMALNAICMKILSKQAAYPDSLASNEVLNDFSTLMQGGAKTESGNISSLLDELVQSIIDEGKLEQARKMTTKELYQFLANPISSSSSGGGRGKESFKGATLFRKFLKKNGHRSFKEFDFNTLTWADDPSYIVKSLVVRLRLYKPDEAEQERRAAANRAKENENRVREIMDKKIENGRTLLSGYLLPRARKGTVRRERSKSLLIETISRYRNAFRHLGGLLCLAGRLPSAELVFQLTIEELESFVYLSRSASDHRSGSGGAAAGAGNRADLSRMLYKCRRRQQRARVLDQITYPKPVLDFSDMIELTKRLAGEIIRPPSPGPTGGQDPPGGSAPTRPQVRGITSCAGCVTGRACVVQSLDDMDQIQPNDILVTYSIDISWSVYFFTLAGIVTEVGGIVSHGAVVAREYGIPTLCTAIKACSTFETGQIITLDANQAICYLASDAGDAAGAAEGSSSLSAGKEADGRRRANGDSEKLLLSQQQQEQH